MLEEHALRRLFPLLDDGGERESVFRRVAIGLGANSLARYPWVLAKTVLGVCRANRKVLKVYFAGCVGFVLMKVLKKIMMVV